MTLVFIPQIIIFIFTEELLLLTGQDPAVANYAHLYTLYLIPGVLFFNLFECIRRFMNAQLIFDVPSYVQLITLFLHFFW